MRRALLLILLLLLPSVQAESDGSWTVEVEDPTGTPIENCDVQLKEPWTQAQINEPQGAMWQAAATCPEHVVMWHPPVSIDQTTVVLDAHPIISDLFTVEGAHTVMAIGSTWSIAVSDGPVSAPHGIALVVIGEGGSTLRTGQSHISIPNGTNTYNLSGNYSDSISVKAIHATSGMVIDWIDDNITVGEYGGEWSARVYLDGLPVGEEVWPPTVQWIETQASESVISGLAVLDFPEPLVANSVVNATWFAHHYFSTGIGLPFIPGTQAGILSQIERFIPGGVIDLENLLETMVWAEGLEGLCCMVDHNVVTVNSINIESNIDLSSGYWGWNESANLSAQRSHLDLVRLEAPFHNDLRQLTPLNVRTNGDWQFRSAPEDDWFTGIPSNFTLQRDIVSISGLMTITLAQNQAPVLNILDESALDWNSTHEFVVSINDTAMSAHSCDWNISGITDNSSVDLSQFAKDSNLEVWVGCTDEGGLIGIWNGSFILDDEYPWINASNEVQEIPPGLFTWDLMVGDDHDDNLRVYWTSNKSEGWWYTGDFLETNFYVNSQLNSINDDIETRHQSQGPIEYWLAAEVSDDAGHTTIGNWTIRLTDAASPVLFCDVERLEDGNWNPHGVGRIGDTQRLNLTESFDDHSAIDSMSYTIKINDVIILENGDWSQANMIEFNDLEVGYHLAWISATDEAGNTGGIQIGVVVAPPLDVDIEIEEVRFMGEDVSPGPNQFWVELVNHGAYGTNVTVCAKDVCVHNMIDGGTAAGPGRLTIPMNVELGWFDTLELEYTFVDDEGEVPVTIIHSTQYSSGAGIGGLELSLLCGISILIILWWRWRNQPRF